MAEKITSDSVVTSTELAVVLGLSVRRIQQLSQDGIIIAETRGKYLLADSIQRYINFLDKPIVNEEEAKAEKIKNISEAQIKASKAAILKLEAEELKGNMHRADDVEKLTEVMVFTIRNALLALPGRLAVDVASCNTAAEASGVIRKEVNAVMLELSNFHYDPKKYEELVRERRSWTPRDDEEVTNE